MNCPNCNHPIQPNQKFCEACGQKVEPQPLNVNQTQATEPFENTSLEYQDDFQTSEVNTQDINYGQAPAAPQPSEYYQQPAPQPQQYTPYQQPAAQPYGGAPQPPKKSNTPLIIIIIVLAVLLVGGGVFTAIMLINNNKDGNDNDKNSSSVVSAQSSSSSFDVDSSSSQTESSRYSFYDDESGYNDSSDESGYSDSSDDEDDEKGITLSEAKAHSGELEQFFLENAAENDEAIKATDKIEVKNIYYCKDKDDPTTVYIAFAYYNSTQKYYNVLYMFHYHLSINKSKLESDSTFMMTDGPADTLSEAVDNCWFLSESLGKYYDSTKIL